MKLFKNKVGRPTNEIKNSRKIFTLSVIGIIISVIALLLSSICLKIVGNGNLKAAASKSKVNFTVESSNSNGIKADNAYRWDFYAKDLKKRDKDGSCNVGNYHDNSLKYCEHVNIEIENETGGNIYYRWFTDNSKYDGEHHCENVINDGDSISKSFSFTFGSDNNREGWIRVYKTQKQCKDDDSHNKTHLDEINIKYNLKSGNSTGTKVESSSGLLEAIARFFVSIFKAIFQIKDDKPDGTGTEESNRHENRDTTNFDYKTIGSVEYKIIKYDYNHIKSNIGPQTLNDNCYTYAVKYGNYIAGAGYSLYKDLGNSDEDICSGSARNRYDIIKTKIDAGLPVLLHVETKRGNEHWITITGYALVDRGNISDSTSSNAEKSKVLEYIYGIDPWGPGVPGAPKQNVAYSVRESGYFKLHSDGRCYSWAKN